MSNERPCKAPLRKIVLRKRSKYRHTSLTLECGHTTLVSDRSYTARTRCYQCLGDIQGQWDADHTCEHGVVAPRHCKDCEIARLRAKVEALRAEVERLRGELHERAWKCGHELNDICNYCIWDRQGCHACPICCGCVGGERDVPLPRVAERSR